MRLTLDTPIFELPRHHIAKLSVGMAQKLAAGQASDYRAVEVRIILNDPTAGSRKLTSERRVVAYVPTP